MKTLGLIGKTLTHSFSRRYFTEKFEREGISGYQYQLFPLATIEDFPRLIAEHPDLVGLNVTIPYKQAIIPYLDGLDASAEFGAVNTIAFEDGKLIGYNTDIYGFKKSIEPLLPPNSKALILGTGGAAKAVSNVLDQLKIKHIFVSRNPTTDRELGYDDLDHIVIGQAKAIINATPLGTFPKETECPDLPYHFLTSNQVLYDLVYNPTVTQFLKNGSKCGCTLKNGLEMLYLQAEKAWEIWTNSGENTCSADPQ